MPRQYRYSQAWFLSPSCREDVGVFFDVSEPERVYLPGRVIAGDAFCFYGNISHTLASPSTKAHLTYLFSRKKGSALDDGEGGTGKAQKISLPDTGCLGTPRCASDSGASYPPGD